MQDYQPLPEAEMDPQNQQEKKEVPHMVLITALSFLSIMTALSMYVIASGIRWTVLHSVIASDLPDNDAEFDSRAKIHNSLCFTSLLPLILGVLVAASLTLSVFRSFYYSISFRSQIVGVTLILVVSLTIAIWSGYNSLDLLYYPQDKMGIADALTESYFDFLYLGSKSKSSETQLYRIMYILHNRIQCCGAHSVNEFHYRTKIKRPFRDNGDWFTVPSFKVHDPPHDHYTEWLGPDFCCRDVDINCGYVNISNFEPNPINTVKKTIWGTPCAPVLSYSMMSSMVDDFYASSICIITCFVYVIFLFRWKRRYEI